MVAISIEIETVALIQFLEYVGRDRSGFFAGLLALCSSVKYIPIQFILSVFQFTLFFIPFTLASELLRFFVCHCLYLFI